MRLPEEMIEGLRLRVFYWWNYKPLTLILLLAAILRVIAVIFSKGYGMHDDHFLVIEVAQKWLEGIPHWFELKTPSLHSLIYPGLHYLLFYGLEALGLTDPQGKMYVVRLIHGAYSMLIVYYGYKIALQISDKRTASIVGMLLATLWCLPFLSVRNLREITCIPPLMVGFYYLLRYKTSLRLWDVVWCGVMFGVAFTFRYQTIFFPIGVGLVLVLQRKWKEVFYFGGAYVVFVSVVQGGVDWVAWGYPFASLDAYYMYNKAHANDFITAPWYNHILTIVGFLVPPVSLMYVWGLLRSWKKHAEIFWPVMLFLIFHSMFPNKQERFIFPLIPFIILLGVVGWREFVKQSVYWQNHQKLLKGLWTFFWVINSIVVVVYSFTYSKRSRVEAMYYLGRKSDFKYALVESYRDHVPFPPIYYLDKWHNLYELGGKSPLRRLRRDIKRIGRVQPNYIVFYGDENLEKRMARVKGLFPDIAYETTIEGSFMDEVLLKLNPRFQANERAYIYKVKD